MDKEKELKKEINDLKKEKKELEKNDIVIKYINTYALIHQKDRELKIYRRDTMFKKFDKCQHYYIFGINSGKTKDGVVCIFCGLKRLLEIGRDEESRIMNEYVFSHENLLRLQGKRTKKSKGYKYYCDMKIAEKIIKKIKEAHKGISDNELIKYFEIALDNMMDIPVIEERVEDRAKRLKTSVKKIKYIHKKQ